MIKQEKSWLKPGMLLIFLVCLYGCGGKKNSPDNPTPPVTPGKAILTFPAQNSLCNAGNIISDQQVSLTLTWGAASNAANYEVDIKNLQTGVSLAPQTVTATQLTVTLPRAMPYSWSVTAKSSNGNATASDTWRFYVAGAGTVSYDPFPATIVSPTFGQTLATGTTAVNLTWTGADVDNDIASYDVYFGTTASPAVYKSGITTQTVGSPTLNANTTYYWKVITKDTQGNTSDSGVYQFSVN